MRLPLVSDRAGLIAMAVIFSVLVILSVIYRLRARKLTRARLETDDWLALISLFFVLGVNSTFIAGTAQRAITGHSNVVNGIAVTNELEILTQKYKYAYQTTEKVAFGLIKLSILFLWKRLFGRRRAFTVLCYIMIGIIIAWTIAFFFETVFQCGTDWSMNWAPIFIFLAKCTASLDVLTVFGVSDVLTDLVIMILPIPIIWSLQMPRRKKIAVTGIFALGFFTIGAGVARLFYYLATSYNIVENPDFIGDVTLTVLWSTIELNVAMIVCSLPVLSPVFEELRSIVISRLRHFGISKRIDSSTKRSNDSESSQFDDMSRVEIGAGREFGDKRIHSQPKFDCTHRDDDEAITSTDCSRYRHTSDHGYNPGILARTEISTTFEEKSRRNVE